MGVGRKKYTTKELEDILNRGPDLDNYVHRGKDGKIYVSARAGSERKGDYLYALAEQERTDGNIARALDFYISAKEEHTAREKALQNADAETYAALFLICAGIENCHDTLRDKKDKQGLSEREEKAYAPLDRSIKETTDAKSTYFRLTRDAYYALLESIPESDTLMHYIINTRVSDLGRRMGFRKWADTIKSEADRFLQAAQQALQPTG